MTPASKNVNTFPMIMGICQLYTPYIIQRNTPEIKSRYIGNDKPFVFRVFMVFNACGKKLMVVSKAAIFPMMFTVFMKQRSCIK